MNDTELARMLVQRSYHERQSPQEPFLLASGKLSWHYFECQRTTSWAPALPLLGAAFMRRLIPEVRCVGGLTRGADPIAEAIAFHSALNGPRLVHAFSARKELKGHGTQRWIEGSAETGDCVAVVDDVITSGGSVITAIQRCRLESLELVQVVVLVDREEGGLDAIRKEAGRGVPVDALFRYSELRALWRELNEQSGSEPDRATAAAP